MTTTVTVNGEAQPLQSGVTVGDVVDGLGRGRAGVAVAVNGEVVPRSAWDERRLYDDDRLEVLTVAQGG
ncbi:MAG: sulfur carrier protein ThiS [Acidimicrobiales bacterium]